MGIPSRNNEALSRGKGLIIFPAMRDTPRETDGRSVAFNLCARAQLQLQLILAGEIYHDNCTGSASGSHNRQAAFRQGLYICAAADAAAALDSSPGRESSVAEGGSEGGNHSN